MNIAEKFAVIQDHWQPRIVGEFIIITRGVEQLPVAEDEVHVMLLKPKTTLNTGNVRSERTVDAEWL